MLFCSGDEITLTKQTFPNGLSGTDRVAIYDYPAAVWLEAEKYFNQVAEIHGTTDRIMLRVTDGNPPYYLMSEIFEQNGQRYTALRKASVREDAEPFLIYKSGPNLTDSEWWGLVRAFPIIKKRLESLLDVPSPVKLRGSSICPFCRMSKTAQGPPDSNCGQCILCNKFLAE